jgi:hypothetical protein
MRNANISQKYTKVNIQKGGVLNIKVGSGGGSVWISEKWVLIFCEGKFEEGSLKEVKRGRTALSLDG